MGSRACAAAFAADRQYLAFMRDKQRCIRLNCFCGCTRTPGGPPGGPRGPREAPGTPGRTPGSHHRDHESGRVALPDWTDGEWAELVAKCGCETKLPGVKCLTCEVVSDSTSVDSLRQNHGIVHVQGQGAGPGQALAFMRDAQRCVKLSASCGRDPNRVELPGFLHWDNEAWAQIVAEEGTGTKLQGLKCITCGVVEQNHGG